MEFICTKGIGKTHAKWSPVCTSFYRYKMDIRLLQPIKGKDAKDLKKLCPSVFEVENDKAVIKNQEYHAMLKELLRDERFCDKISLGKRKDVFEFHVESVGMYAPEDIVIQSIGILKDKVHKWMEILSEEQDKDEDSPMKN